MGDLAFIQVAVCKLLIIIVYRNIFCPFCQSKNQDTASLHGTFSFENSRLLLRLQVLSENEKLKKYDKSI